MRIKQFTLALGVILLSLSSCEKDSDDSSSSTPQTKTQMLTGRTWKMTSAKISPGIVQNGIVLDDFFSFIPVCERDNTITFKTDMTIVRDEGATKRDPNDLQAESGSWSFQDNETAILTIVNGESDLSKIDKLTSSEVVISSLSNDFPDQQTRTVILTFK